MNSYTLYTAKLVCRDLILWQFMHTVHRIYL